jgi:hypothetical protein
MNVFRTCVYFALALAISIGSAATFGQARRRTPTSAPATAAPPAMTPPTELAAGNGPETGTETIVFLRHAEKPRHGLGQLTPQGLNRALALVDMLPKKFGKPDYIFAPDPIQKADGEPGYYYVRPLATIEPLAISLEMPVQTPFGYKQIDKLNAELIQPKYSSATVFVAWEHAYEDAAVKNLVKQLGGDGAAVPGWPGGDFDSLFVVKITRPAGKPLTVSFAHEHEDLDNQSTKMPMAAAKSDH